MAEWLIASVLKTEDGKPSGGSNPSPSEVEDPERKPGVFFINLFSL